jgi:GNAT superfamily N-acetyltransferase
MGPDAKGSPLKSVEAAGRRAGFPGAAGLCDRCSMPVRSRVEADIDTCVQLASVVHEVDGYPTYLPDDLRVFIGIPDALGAWVAEEEGEIVGHVALNPRSSPPVMKMASEALGLRGDRLGVVARLLVSPLHRRRGLGRALLETASDEAHARGLWPVLDAVTGHQAAIELYDRCGWVRAGKITVRWGDYPEVEELVYLGPRPPASGTSRGDQEALRDAPPEDR